MAAANTHISASTDLGLMKTAMGNTCACCSLLMALPDTSRMQCLPWKSHDASAHPGRHPKPKHLPTGNPNIPAGEPREA